MMSDYINNDYINQLMNYLEALTRLKGSGFTCTKEIQDVIKKLHSSMGFGTEKDVLKKLEEQVASDNNGNKLIAVTEKHRGIGKTTKLVELAKKYNLPIVVANNGHARYILEIIEPPYDVQIIVADHETLKDLRKKDVSNGVLVDSPLTIWQYYDLLLSNVKIRGGFFQIDGYFI